MGRFALFSWLALAGCAHPDAAAFRERPNILFIYTDDQSWRTLACYRDQGAWPWVETPHIDRLAAEGVRFTHAYGAAWCVPSRATFLTGLLPHGIQGLRMASNVTGTYDPGLCRFWPGELRKGGYQTAFFGKWHLGPDAGHGREWDRSVVWNTRDVKWDWYNNQVHSIDGAEGRVLPGYTTDLYTQYSVDFIRQAHAKPWFLWLSPLAPHFPYLPAPRHADRYKDAQVSVPSDVFGPHPGKPGYMEGYTVWERGTGAREGVPLVRNRPLADWVRAYNRTVCAVDEGVGRILEALEETGQLDRTLVVFTSDQGFAWGEHGFGEKLGPYEACMRMPMIVRLPGVAARGRTCRLPVAIADLPPTFLALAGVPPPWPMHGHDLSPILRDPQAEWNHPVLLEHFHASFGSQAGRGMAEGPTPRGLPWWGVPWWLALREGRWKYIRTLVAGEIEELYDLEADPDEHRNLALEPARRGLVEDRRSRLIAELRRTGGDLADHLPPVR